MMQMRKKKKSTIEPVRNMHIVKDIITHRSCFHLHILETTGKLEDSCDIRNDFVIDYALLREEKSA